MTVFEQVQEALATTLRVPAKDITETRKSLQEESGRSSKARKAKAKSNRRKAS